MLFTVSTDFDPTGEAGKLSGAAETARFHGNMQEARKLHEEAAKKLEADIVNHPKQSDKEVIRFLAATQYYLGGRYSAAESTCRRIKADLLPDRLHELYRKFLRDVKERAKPDYLQKLRTREAQFQKKGNTNRFSIC